MANVKKLNMAAMKKAAGELGLKLPKGDPAVAAKILQTHFEKNYEADSLAECLECGYPSNDQLSVCPYCGVELGEAKEPEPEEKKPKGKKGETRVAKKKGKGGKIQKVDAKKAEECKEHLGKILAARQNLAEKAWLIGAELSEIHDKNLWKHMGYKSFSEFCGRELDYTRVMAYKYMAVSKALSEDEVKLLGVAKAEVIVSAPPRQKKALMEMAKEGKSKKDLVTFLRKKEGKTGGAPAGEPKITILGRVNEKDPVFSPWLGDSSGKPTKMATKQKHVTFEIVTGVTVTVRISDDERGLLFRFAKVESEEKDEPANGEPAPPDAEDADDAADADDSDE